MQRNDNKDQQNRRMGRKDEEMRLKNRDYGPAHDALSLDVNKYDSTYSNSARMSAGQGLAAGSRT